MNEMSDDMGEKRAGDDEAADYSRDIAVAVFMLKGGDELIDWLSARLTKPGGSVEVRDSAATALTQFIALKENLQKLVDQVKSDQGNLS